MVTDTRQLSVRSIFRIEFSDMQGAGGEAATKILTAAALGWG
jgi:hypothetical protein